MADKKILFCWSGGGFPGLDIHMGIWKALTSYGIESTHNAGTSAGSIMAAFNSSRLNLFETQDLLKSLTDQDIRRERFLWKLRMPWIDYWMETSALNRLLLDELPLNFSDLKKPLTVFVTNERTGAAVELIDGWLNRALLASSAIAGVFPSQNLLLVGGHPLLATDGGTSSNIPLPHNFMDYDEIYILIAARPLEYRRHGILTRLMYNIDLLVEGQMQQTIERAQRMHGKIHIIRPPVRVTCGTLHFDHNLINEAYEFTRQIIGGMNASHGG